MNTFMDGYMDACYGQSPKPNATDEYTKGYESGLKKVNSSL